MLLPCIFENYETVMNSINLYYVQTLRRVSKLQESTVVDLTIY